MATFQRRYNSFAYTVMSDGGGGTKKPVTWGWQCHLPGQQPCKEAGLPTQKAAEMAAEYFIQTGVFLRQTVGSEEPASAETAQDTETKD